MAGNIEHLMLEQFRKLREQNERILDTLRINHEDAMIMRLRVQANTRDVDSQRDALARRAPPYEPRPPKRG
jgi:hypothetical protein